MANSTPATNSSPNPIALAKRLTGVHHIDGRLVPPRAGKTFKVLNPATGEFFAEAAAGDKQDVDAAVQAAAKAQKKWAKRPARERGKLVTEVGRLIQDHAEELAQLMTLETGKAI